MIQVNIPSGGTVMESPNGKNMWMNPARDIAHCFVDYFSRASVLLEDPCSELVQWYYDQGGSDDEIRAGLRFVTEFVRATVDHENVQTVVQAAERAGYKDLPLRVRLLIGHALFNVIISAYFKGFRSANFTGRDAADTVPSVADFNFARFEGNPLRRWTKAILRKVYLAL